MQNQNVDNGEEQTYVINGQVYTQSQVEQMYQQAQNIQELQGGHEEMAQPEQDEQFADSRIVKTVRSLRRQNSASRTSFTQQQVQDQQYQQQMSAYQQQQFQQQPQQQQYRQQMNYTGDQNQMNMQGRFSSNQNKPMTSSTQSTQPLTAYQRRMMEKNTQKVGEQGMSLEDRLNKLKQIHQKPQIQMRRPNSGLQRQMQQRQVVKKPSMPLDPIDFQQQLAKRSQEEAEQMEKFKAHEEKMKAFQEAKRAGGRPPISNQLAPVASSKNLTTDQNENQPPIKNAVRKPQRNNKTVLAVGKRQSQKLSHRPSSSTKRASNNTFIPDPSQSNNTKTSTANDNRANNGSELGMQDSDDDQPTRGSSNQEVFSIERETGERGAKKQSNELLSVEKTLIGSKKDKCLETFKNCHEIRELITSRQLNPDRIELNEIVNQLFDNQHFNNMLGDLLSKKSATTRLEKFFSQKVKERLRELKLDKGIATSFQNINQRMQERLAKIRATTMDFDIEEPQ